MIQLWISEGAYFVDSLTEYYPIVFAIECGVVYKIWVLFEDTVSISFKHLSSWCLFVDPHQLVYNT